MAAILDAPERIAVVRALPGFGDLLCAVPALRALRRAFPRARVTLVGLPAARWFVDRFDRYVDDLLVLPGFPGLPEQAFDAALLPAFLDEAHRRRFDLGLQLHGSGLYTNVLTALLGARLMAGSYLPGEWRPDTRGFIPYPQHDPEIQRLLRVLERLEIPTDGEHLELPVRPEDEEDLHTVLGERLQAGGYACLHPGASEPFRRWPAERFARVGDRLATRGLRVAITGTADESGIAAAVAGAMSASALDLTGRTSVGALAALVLKAGVVVCNDTGVSHLAAALRVPSVVVFTGSDAARWAPLDPRLHRAVVGGRSNGAPEPDTVAGVAEDLLDRTLV